MKRSLIICIGNELVADDGAGFAVYEALQQTGLQEDVRLIFLGLGGIDLLDAIDGEDMLVVVDGVQLGGEPGTVHVLDWDSIPAREERPVSGHGIGVREAINVAERLYPEKVPGNTFLVGLEGRCFDRLGQGLSQEVADSVPRAVEVIRQLIASDNNCR